MRLIPKTFRDSVAAPSGRRADAWTFLGLCGGARGLLLLAAAIPLLSGFARAANDNWTSTSSSLWGTSGNWSGGVPVASSSVFFNTTAGQQSAITLAGSSLATSLTFSSAGGAKAFTFDTAVTLNTNTLTLSGGIVNSDAALQTFYNKVVLAGNQSWTATSGALVFNGDVNLGASATSYTLTLDGANAVGIAGKIANGGTAAGNVAYSGTSTLTLSGANTYSGTTTINSGTLIAGNATALGTTAGGTTVASGGTLALQGGIAVAEGLTLSGTGASANAGALSNSSGTNTLSGTVALASGTTVSAAAGSQLTLSGTISGTAPLTFGKGTSTGTVVLSGANTYQGATAITAGTVLVQSGGSSRRRG